MNRPVIFSEKEIKARHQFALFFNMHFEMEMRSSHFPKPLDSVALLELFKMSQVHYRRSAAKLDLHQLEHLLLFGGYSRNQEDIIVQCNIRMEKFQFFNSSVQLMLLDMVLPKVGLQLRQELDTKEHPDIKDAYIPKSIRLFCETMLFTRKHFQWYEKIPTKYDRVSVPALYAAYTDFCAQRDFPPLGKKQLISYLAGRGYPTTKGYYGGIGGVVIIRNLAIPWGDDLLSSLELGLGHITQEEYVHFNDNRRYRKDSKFPQVEMKTYIAGRLNKLYEQEGSAQASQEIDAAEYYREHHQNVDRRADEAGAPINDGGASGTAQADSGNRDGKAQQAPAESAQVQDEDAQAYHGGLNVAEGDDKPAARSLSGVQPAALTEDRSTESRSGLKPGNYKAVVTGVDHAKVGEDVTVIGEGVDGDGNKFRMEYGIARTDHERHSEDGGIGEIELAERKERERDLWNGLKAEAKKELKHGALESVHHITLPWVTDFIVEMDEEIYTPELADQLLKRLWEEIK